MGSAKEKLKRRRIREEIWASQHTWAAVGGDDGRAKKPEADIDLRKKLKKRLGFSKETPCTAMLSNLLRRMNIG